MALGKGISSLVLWLILDIEGNYKLSLTGFEEIFPVEPFA